jgi:hypothetical protein
LLAVGQTISLATDLECHSRTPIKRDPATSVTQNPTPKNSLSEFHKFMLDASERRLIQTCPITKLEPDSAKTNENAPQWMCIY